jgi:sugar phosphate isomerase/epimerase
MMNRRSFLASPLAAAAPALGSQGSPSRKPRLRTAICAYSFRKELAAKTMTYEDLVHKCVDWDVDGLDLTVYWFPPEVNASWLLPLRRAAYLNGVEIYSISVRTEMTQATPEARDRQVAEVRKWVDVADMLGASHIRVFGGNVPKTATEEQAVPWVVECLSRGGEYAASKGVILGLENHGGITLRAERIIEIVKKVNSPWVMINLDTGNFRTEAFKQIEMCLPLAANVQVKSEMTDDAGKRGPQDWDRVVRMIAASGYRGYLALEYEAAEPAPEAVPRHMAQLRHLTRKYSS